MPHLTPLGLAREAEHQQRLRSATDLLASLDVDDLRRLMALVSTLPVVLAVDLETFAAAFEQAAADAGLPARAAGTDRTAWLDTELAAVIRTFDVVTRSRTELG